MIALREYCGVVNGIKPVVQVANLNPPGPPGNTPKRGKQELPAQGRSQAELGNETDRA